jgi:hypothetical protein
VPAAPRLHPFRARRRHPPAAPPGRVVEWCEGSFRCRDDGQAPWGRAPGDESRQIRHGIPGVDTDDRRKLRIGGGCPFEDESDDRVRFDARRRRQGADESPLMADPGNERS